ncbi:MAG: glutamine--tRNA ligase/YqeY domain fusion protein [Chitinophagales bacterium]|nr:glutamine--tRNA ligase/YqeY domain fusion protein [Chitinophagales bacterium]MDW8393444.1 glutamine--tRNA ligase/YqeY domain fusion protein [Chitinophagales bacterium]
MSAKNFLEEIIEADLKSGRHQRIVTRFPPEPNGYLHIGHAKSIHLNFGLADKYGGITNLRFDDTNPTTEETEYVESIKRDIRWLGYEWENEFYASDYFERLYEFAEKLIRKGLAYVDDSTSEEIAAMKGTPTSPGINSPYRNRSVEENLDLFRRMRAGEFPDGMRVLRAKIDMASPNMHLRDPVMYRIKHEAHHRTGTDWCIYPMYDFAHGQCDSLEGITHSICTMEFEVHRPLYEWFIEQLEIFPSRQYEFARLNLSYTVLSKRKLLQLVNEGHVSGWDDPRMPTLSGLRRRGYTPEAIREFCERIGVARRDNVVDVGLLEYCIREDLNRRAQRRMVVLSPLKLILTNYPEGQTEWLPLENNPEDASAGMREVPFSRELYMEQEDFMEMPVKGFLRMAPGRLVRLKGAYVVRCDDVVKDEKGAVVAVRATYLPETRSGGASEVKVKSTLHWVCAAHAVPVKVLLYDRLFQVEHPAAQDEPLHTLLNPQSLAIVEQAMAEPSLRQAAPGEYFQFLRKGYFTPDLTTTPDRPVFNRTVTLKDHWAAKQPAGAGS